MFTHRVPAIPARLPRHWPILRAFRALPCAMPPIPMILICWLWVSGCARACPMLVPSAIWPVCATSTYSFGTLGAWPHSEHARRCLVATHELLQAGGNTVVDGFLCQGRVNPQVIAASQRKGGHPMSAERRARLLEAERHPDAADLTAARLHWQRSLQKFAPAALNPASIPCFATGILPTPPFIGNNPAL